MIFGAHLVLNSKDADADRSFLDQVLGLRSVDAGRGWLIFALPPAELAVHPASPNAPPELYLMSNDLAADVARLEEHSVSCSQVVEARWGSVARFRLPGGSKVGLYQPKHPTALNLS